MYVAYHSNNFLSTTCSYVYDTDVGGNMPSYKDYKYGVEYMFISLLAKSKFRTKVSCAYGRSTIIRYYSGLPHIIYSTTLYEWYVYYMQGVSEQSSLYHSLACQSPEKTHPVEALPDHKTWSLSAT